MEKASLFSSSLNMVKTRWPDFPMKRENLDKPTPQFARDYFARFLYDFDNTTQEMASFPQDCQLQRESCTWDDEVYLFVRMNQILKNVMLEFFTLSDIRSPVKKRFQTIVTITMSLLVYMHSIIRDVQKITGDLWKVLANRIKEKEEEEELKANMNTMAITKVTADKNIAALKEELEMLKEKHRKMKRTEQQEIELNNKRQIMNRLKEKCQKSHEASENLVIENKLLKEQVVDAAEVETIQQECADLKKKIETKSEYIEEYHKTLQEKQKTFDHFTLLEQIANNIDYDTHQKTAKELRDGQGQISILNQNLCKLNTEIKNTDFEKLKLNENICFKEEALQSTQVQFLSIKKSQQKEIINVKKEYETTVRDREDKQCLTEKYAVELKELETECKTIKNEIKEFNKAAAEEYRLLLESENQLTTHFHKCLEELSKNENSQ